MLLHAEILSYGSLGERDYLIVYGEPGELAEIAFAAEAMPHLQGAVSYRHFDAETKTATFGFYIEASLQMFLWNGKLQIVALPRDLAERTWTQSSHLIQAYSQSRSRDYGLRLNVGRPRQLRLVP